jgi:hypothetical protein
MAADSNPVAWVGRQAAVTLPEHIDVSNAGQIREELLSLVNRGAAVLALSAIDMLFFIPAYPFRALTIIAMDVVALWGCAPTAAAGTCEPSSATVQRHGATTSSS